MITLDRAALLAAHTAAHDRITDAYWTFSRSRRGAPCCVTAADAYSTRRTARALLRMVEVAPVRWHS